MQAAPETAEAPEPIGLVLDGEMRGEPNSLFGFAAALGLSTLETPEANILTFSLSRSSLTGAAFLDALARFHTMLALRDYPERFRRYRQPLPIGLDSTMDAPAPAEALEQVLAKTDADGEPLYPHEVHEFTDTADPAAVIRNGLTAEEDQSVAVVLNGPARNLVRVLGLNGGQELVEAKVKRLIMTAGDLPGAAPCSNAKADIAAMKELLAKWPTPIVAVGASLGEELRISAEEVLAGFDWTEQHPLVAALREQQIGSAEVSARESAAALHAVRPDAGYFKQSEGGVLTVDDNGVLGFKPSADGAHTFLTVDSSRIDEVRELCVDLISRRPAARELPDFLKRFIERQKEEEEEEKKQQTDSRA